MGSATKPRGNRLTSHGALRAGPARGGHPRGTGTPGTPALTLRAGTGAGSGAGTAPHGARAAAPPLPRTDGPGPAAAPRVAGTATDPSRATGATGCWDITEPASIKVAFLVQPRCLCPARGGDRGRTLRPGHLLLPGHCPQPVTSSGWWPCLPCPPCRDSVSRPQPVPPPGPMATLRVPPCATGPVPAPPAPCSGHGGGEGPVALAVGRERLGAPGTSLARGSAVPSRGWPVAAPRGRGSPAGAGAGQGRFPPLVTRR